MATALIKLYSKCGSILEAYGIFRMTPVKRLSCWNPMIQGLACNGHEEAGLSLFSGHISSCLMLDSATFVAVSQHVISAP